MTDNNRFKVKVFDVYDQVVWDTEFEESCSVEQVVNMLNNKDWVIDTLEEENEQLKDDIKLLKARIDVLNDEIEQHKVVIDEK